ncbi:transglycosylase SLT domain-containing protein [Roseomonas elaeocarpi]|uniref:Transglycosylase SLT domain-containing protein n=1 Tax=Roseomonas elaeocarpi TaxID=907779 RepID=A0ABV6JUN5_9PROT
MRRLCTGAALAGVIAVSGSGVAQARGNTAPAGDNPRAACLAAARMAEAESNLPQGLLVAVALAESGLHAYALNIGGRSYFPEDSDTAHRLLAGSKPQQSVMAGCVQINARVHARNSDWPLDPIQATRWAARHLREKFNQTGDWGDAIRRWNGGAARTANNLVCRIQAKLEVTNPGSRILSDESCGGGFARDRRNGAALLEIAEAPDR